MADRLLTGIKEGPNGMSGLLQRVSGNVRTLWSRLNCCCGGTTSLRLALLRDLSRREDRQGEGTLFGVAVCDIAAGCGIAV